MALAQKLWVRALPTMANSVCPIFFIARAIEPIFPEPRGLTRTIRMLASMTASSEFFGTMKGRSVPGKRTQLIFYDNTSVFGVEFGSVAQVFVHNRCTVVDVFGTEDVAEFVNQSNNIRFRFGVRAGVTKWFVDRRNDIIAQPLLTIADAINTGPTGDEVTAYAFRGEYYNQIIAPVLLLVRKVLLDFGQQVHCGVYPFLNRPWCGALGDKPNGKFTFVIIGGCFDQSACLIRPTGVP